MVLRFEVVTTKIGRFQLYLFITDQKAGINVAIPETSVKNVIVEIWSAYSTNRGIWNI
jgi:hypothetical protein